ncbi:hypothetical protein PSTG_04553 [Puccinia striiformis f. sp. tritici PST-78]|uniref:Uncharacterized protein n=3 Tax=Puccinia striiformis TaxID=27350 RepID=A0A0L0VSU2_9BASI|nr:hypothetical protein PSTG_04553 [Puccinia striiformis f. sp. tritici PST-78]
MAANNLACPHYSGPVTHSVEGFLIQNPDLVSPPVAGLHPGRRGPVLNVARLHFGTETLRGSISVSGFLRPRMTSVMAGDPHDVPEKSTTDHPGEEVPKEDAAGKVETDRKLVVFEFNESLTTLLETLQDTKTCRRKLEIIKIFMNDARSRQSEDRLKAVDEDEQRNHEEKAVVQAHGNSSEIGLPLVSNAAEQAGHMGGGGYYDDDRKTTMTETE